MYANPGEQLDAAAGRTGAHRVHLGLIDAAARDPHEMDELVDSTIRQALDADGDTSGDLLATLRAYLDHGGRPNTTAEAVHAHRHTFGYRLDRIADLTGHDPRTPDGQRQLTLGLQPLALRAVVAAPAT